MSKYDIDNDLRSLGKKIKISENDKASFRNKLTNKLGNGHSKKTFNITKRKYFLTLASAFTIFTILFFTNTFGLLNKSNQGTVEIAEMVRIIHEDLDIGMSMNEVYSLLGSNYSEVKSAKYDELMWRYDFNTVNDYSFEEKYDFADLEGIKNGEVEMQIWVTWNDNEKVNSINALYVNSSNEIVSFERYSDGTIREYTISRINTN